MVPFSRGEGDDLDKRGAASLERPFKYLEAKNWILRRYLGSPALLRSKWSGNGWREPELIISQFATEPTLDNAGNLYFVHHFIENGRILDADIYVAYRKQ